MEDTFANLFFFFVAVTPADGVASVEQLKPAMRIADLMPYLNGMKRTDENAPIEFETEVC